MGLSMRRLNITAPLEVAKVFGFKKPKPHHPPSQDFVISKRVDLNKEGEERTSFMLTRKPAPERNAQCPCGSGKKFKKCHGGKS